MSAGWSHRCATQQEDEPPKAPCRSDAPKGAQALRQRQEHCLRSHQEHHGRPELPSWFDRGRCQEVCVFQRSVRYDYYVHTLVHFIFPDELLWFTVFCGRKLFFSGKLGIWRRLHAFRQQSMHAIQSMHVIGLMSKCDLIGGRYQEVRVCSSWDLCMVFSSRAFIFSCDELLWPGVFLWSKDVLCEKWNFSALWKV